MVATDGPSLDTVVVNTTFVPGVARSGPSLATVTSAMGATGLMTVAGSGCSGPEPSGSICAVLVIAVVAAGSTVTWNTRLAERLGPMTPGRSPRSLISPPRAKGIVPPTSGMATAFRVVLPAMYVVPAGMGSVSVTPVAAAVPVFWIVTAYLSGAPGTAGVGDAVLATSMRGTSVVTVFVVNVPFCVGCPAQLTYW